MRYLLPTSEIRDPRGIDHHSASRVAYSSAQPRGIASGVQQGRTRCKSPWSRRGSQSSGLAGNALLPPFCNAGQESSIDRLRRGADEARVFVLDEAALDLLNSLKQG